MLLLTFLIVFAYVAHSQFDVTFTPVKNMATVENMTYGFKATMYPTKDDVISNCSKISVFVFCSDCSPLEEFQYYSNFESISADYHLKAYIFHDELQFEVSSANSVSTFKGFSLEISNIPYPPSYLFTMWRINAFCGQDRVTTTSYFMPLALAKVSSNKKSLYFQTATPSLEPGMGITITPISSTKFKGTSGKCTQLLSSDLINPESDCKIENNVFTANDFPLQTQKENVDLTFVNGPFSSKTPNLNITITDLITGRVYYTFSSSSTAWAFVIIAVILIFT
jgi:hypothetical protein